MMPVKKTYAKILLMTAAVLVALILGFILSDLLILIFWDLAKPRGHKAAMVVWSVVPAIIASFGTYAVAYLLIRKCGFGHVKWLNIVCFLLTLLWCLFVGAVLGMSLYYDGI